MILLLFLAAAVPLDNIYQGGDYERVVQLAPSFLADSARTAADSSTITFSGGGLTAISKVVVTP